MFRLSRRAHTIRISPLLLLAALFCGHVFGAQTLDYSADPTLASTPVMVVALASRTVPLVEILTLVEKQTNLKVDYSADGLSLQGSVTIGTEGAMSLARLLAIISEQQDVVFGLRDRQITVRPKHGEVAADALESPSTDDHAGAFATNLKEISENQTLSPLRQEKQISTLVRDAVMAAVAGRRNPAEILSLASDLVETAAGTAPQFVNVIANAASFSPPVARIRGSAARIRAAAYAGSRSPGARSGKMLQRDRAATAQPWAGAGTAPLADFASTRETNPTVVPVPSAAPAAVATTDAAAPTHAVPTDATVAVAPGPAEPATPVESFGVSPPALAIPPLEMPSNNAAPPPAEEVVQMEAMAVEGKVVRNSQTVLRQRASVSVDVVTSREFVKFVATDVSDIVIRMPGFSTTTRGSFAVVRGLAERYNPVMLDGVVLPSSDPERQTPELDLFPTRLVDTVAVSKVFEPRLPATASGGAVDLLTKPLPEGRFAQIQFGVRADEGALKDEVFFGTKSGTWTRFALGTKDRASAPAQVTVAEKSVEFKKRLTNLDTPLRSEPRRHPGGVRFTAVFDDRIDLGGDGRALGYSLNVNYDSSATVNRGRVLSIPVLLGSAVKPTKLSAPEPGTGLGSIEGNDYHESESEVRIGALANFGFAFNSSHTLSLTAFVSQIGIDTVTKVYNGFAGIESYEGVTKLWQAFDAGSFDPKIKYNLENDSLSLSESLHYRQRNLTDLKLAGQHTFSFEYEAKLNWAVAKVSARQEEPDFWSVSHYVVGATESPTPLATILLGTSGRAPTRYWRDVRENTLTGRIDGTTRLDLSWMKGVQAQASLYYDDTTRAFTEESYVLSAGSAGAAPRGKNLDELLAVLRRDAEGFSSNILTPFADAERKMTASGVTLTLPLLAKQRWADRLDLLVGVRVEDYKLAATGRGAIGNADSSSFYITGEVQSLVGAGLLPVTATKTEQLDAARKTIGPLTPGRIFSGTIDETTTHPAFAVTWSPISRLNVRASYSKTVGRPSFREIGPYFTRDEVTDEYQHGNVFLQTSPVRNIDFRVEYFFPRSRDLVAMSFFHKTIERPIERLALVVDLVSRSTASWFNNPNSAKLKGAEIEAAKNLGFLGEVGSSFTLGGNGTFIDAEVGRNSTEPVFPGATEKRRLFDQPEWIANAYLSFDHPKAGFSSTVSWFAIGDVLQKVGVATWSTYTASHDRLDLTLSQRLGRRWQIRFAVKNLTDPPRSFIADPEVTTEEIVLRRFRDGRSYSFTTTYDF